MGKFKTLKNRLTQLYELAVPKMFSLKEKHFKYQSTQLFALQ